MFMKMRTETDSDFLALTAIISVGYQFVFFVATYVFKFDKVSDFAGTSNFVILAVLTLILKGTWHFRQVVLSALTVIWGLCLALFLLMRILQWGEDRRLDQIHGKLGKLAIFWTFQVIWAWTVSLPVTIVNASDHNPSVRGVDIIGWIMWLLGNLCEAAADQQKLSFKNSPRNKGMWCNVGLWKYSRHPNYFGESRGSLVLSLHQMKHLYFLEQILLWWGSFVAATPVLKGAEWLVIFGPVFSTLLLPFATGIPLLEDFADKKFGNAYVYRQYKRVTSPLILLPQVIYGNLPSWFQTFFLFDYPLYSRNLLQEKVGTNQLQDAGEQKLD